MYHQGTVRGSAVRAASLLALAGAGLFGLAATANATGATGTMPVSYSCNLAAYGQGLAPLSVPAALSAESTGLTVTVKLVTQPVQIPAATASALPQLSYLHIAGTASANGMSGSAVNLSGQSGYLGSTGSMTQLPAMTATGSATQTSSGLAAVEVPPTLTLTPLSSASQAQQAPLTCTTSSATTVQVTATTGATAGTTTGATTGTPGQAYTCTVTVGTSTTTASRVPMSLTATGPATAGRQDMVALAAPASMLGSAFPVNASPMSVSGAAALGGTAAGSVPMTGLADTGNGMFRLTGPWMPAEAGMARIFAPHSFAARLREQTAVTVAVACTAVTTTTTTTQVMVQAAASTAGTATASAPAAAAPGAPNTGGGGSLHPSSALPLAAAGAAAVLGGLAVTLYALRRRRGMTG